MNFLRRWIWILAAAAVAIPAIFVVFAGIHLDVTSPTIGAFVYGVGIIGSAFLLSWGCEVAELDIPPALALSVLALIAVLPEYAVSFSLTYQAATDPTYEDLAIANMVGANRTIVGFAWPLIVFLFWLRFGKKEVTLDKTQRVEVGYLGLAGLYSLIIPIKGHIDFFDVVILVALFIVYTARISRSHVEEPELLGPAAVIGGLSVAARRAMVIGMMAFAAFVIFLGAHPFAESLVNTAESFGMDKVFIVQWFAPLASEAPEIVVCVLFTLRGLANDGLGALVASKVNQWTLLIGTLPLVFSLGSGRWRALPLSPEQVGSMLVTSGQTLLAVAIMLNLKAHLWEAALLFGLFVAQFFVPIRMFNLDTHYIFSAIYLGLSVILAYSLRHDLLQIIKTMFDFKKPAKEVAGHNAIPPILQPEQQPRLAEKKGR